MHERCGERETQAIRLHSDYSHHDVEGTANARPAIKRATLFNFF